MSPNDTNTSAVERIAAGSSDWTPGMAEEVAHAAVGDPGACAMYFDGVVHVLVKHIIGWDLDRNKPTPGGGLFGECKGFAAVAEEQRRLSLHVHLMGYLVDVPSTTEDLIAHLRDPANVRNLVRRMAAASQTSHPVHDDEMCDLSNVSHACELNGVHHPDGVADIVALQMPVPNGYCELTKPMPTLKPPLTVHCRRCGESMTARDVMLGWALKHVNDDVRDTYLAGNVRLEGVPINWALLMNADPTTAQVDAETARASSPVGSSEGHSRRRERPWHVRQAAERAKVTLIGLAHIEHKVGHMRGCFKDKSKNKKQRCRHNMPAPTFTTSAVLVNGVPVCTCSTDVCSSPMDHLKLTADWTTADVETMELQVQRRMGFEFTNRHSMVQLGVFRCNVDTAFVVGSPGLTYYLTTYNSKVPDGVGNGSSMVLAYERALRREAAAEHTPTQRLNSRSASFLYSATRVIETGVTSAALHLLRGSNTYFSHKFEPIYVSNVIKYVNGEKIECTVVPQRGSACDAADEMTESEDDSEDDSNPVQQSESQSLVATVPRVIDYACRDDSVCEDTSLYDFRAEVTRCKIVSATVPSLAKRLPLHSSHPLFETHCLSMRSTTIIPEIIGRRLPSNTVIQPGSTQQSNVETTEPGTQRSNVDITEDIGTDESYYYEYVLAMYKPWSRSNPLRQPGESWKAAFNAWLPHRDDRAVEMMAHEQNYYDNQRLARNGTQANRARNDACDSDSDDETYGGSLNISDDERDAGLEASTDASATRPVSPKLALFLRACRSHGAAPSTLEPTPELVEECAKHSAAPSNSDWEPKLAAASGCRHDGTAATPEMSSDTVVVNRSALVSAAFAQEARASGSMQRIVGAGAKLPVTYPSLFAVEEIYTLNKAQCVAFRTAGCILLRYFLLNEPECEAKIEASDKIEARLCSHLSKQLLFYLGGEGGTGKSTVIRAIEHFSISWGIRKALGITAPTGAAAVEINGSTIHSFAGINSFGKATEAATSAQAAATSLSGIALLILDEVSLVSAELLGTISNTLSSKRGNKTQRFGGMSVMFSGDFGQLKPVSGHALYAIGDEAAVDVAVPSTALNGHQTWLNELTGCVMLSENYRAKNDPAFVSFLRRLRRRCVTVEDVGRLETRRIRPSHCPTVDAAAVFYADSDVNAANCARVHEHAKRVRKNVF